ncbi:hypothetical protein [Streptomyces sp. DH37]|uniref:hypothetical protein n=1 Tax=Streptomyces sp. DH37 TaxID=3040122 RepID=UPI002442BD0D|nr:hypothetical protein [Streptomyces sp. DH37]MDG9706258.1 hypothetical protein [Streptomyces sp. DH37]
MAMTHEKAPGPWARTEGLKDQLQAGSSDSVQRATVNRDRARWHITLGSIRAHLDEQPTPRARRAAARRWCAAITAMADEEVTA